MSDLVSAGVLVHVSKIIGQRLATGSSRHWFSAFLHEHAYAVHDRSSEIARLSQKLHETQLVCLMFMQTGRRHMRPSLLGFRRLIDCTINFCSLYGRFCRLNRTGACPRTPLQDSLGLHTGTE